MEKQIKLSIHPKLTPNLDKATGGKVSSDGWIQTSVPWDKDSLKDAVLKTGYSPAIYYNGVRKDDHVQQIHAIILDFDKNIPTVEQFIKIGSRFQFSWFLHTTTNHQVAPRGVDPNHPNLAIRGQVPLDPKDPKFTYWDPTSPDCPENPANHVEIGSPIDKFRVIIPLAYPISRLTLAQVEPFFLGKFPDADGTSFQAGRHYHPPKQNANFLYEIFNPNDIPIFLNIDDLPKTYQKKLSIDASDYEAIKYISDKTRDFDVVATEGVNKSKKFTKAQVEHKRSGSNNTQVRDAFTLKDAIRFKDTYITTTLEDFLETDEIRHGQTTPIFCPWCVHDYRHRGNPYKDNAFITRNAHGQLFISCTSERTTYWGPVEVIEDENYKVRLFYNTITKSESTFFAIEEVREIEKRALARDIAISTGDEVKGPEMKIKLHESAANRGDWLNLCDKLEVSPDISPKLPRVDPVFMPHYKYGVILDETKKVNSKSAGIYNTFLPSIYYEKYLDGEYCSDSSLTLDIVPKELAARTPLIYHILNNLFGEDDETLSAFVNWIASILRNPERHVDSAWIIGTETQGVGKDFMFHHILTPLFGKRQTQLVDGKNIDNHFNASDATTWLRGYNEFFIKGDVSANNAKRAQLKAQITDRDLWINEKHVKEYESQSFLHFILFSNDPVPMFIEPGDRRFNISWTTKEQSCKLMELDYYQNNFKNRYELEAGAAREVPRFAELIFTMKYDSHKADHGIINDAKKQLIDLSLNTLDRICAAIQGDPDNINLYEVLKFDILAKQPHLDTQDKEEEMEAEINERMLVAEYNMREYNFVHSKDMHAIKKYYNLLKIQDEANLEKSLKKNLIFYQRQSIKHPTTDELSQPRGYKYNPKKAKRDGSTD